MDGYLEEARERQFNEYMKTLNEVEQEPIYDDELLECEGYKHSLCCDKPLSEDNICTYCYERTDNACFTCDYTEECENFNTKNKED